MSSSDALAVARLQRLHGRNHEQGKSRVLIVEDSKSIQALLCAHINDISGIEADAAATLAEAKILLEARASDYFIAVLDLNLPDAPDGEIVDFVQSFGVPVIVMTGSVDERIRQQMLEKNVLDYVVKRQATEIEHVTYIVGRIYENHEVKVLVVDDSPSFRMYLVELLKSYQYQTFQAVDGLDALEVLAENPDIALILTDYNMPRMNGQELVQAVRKDHRREDLAIIGLSDASRSDLSALMLKSGANDFLSKPFQIEEFYCRVTQNTNMIGYVRQVKEGATKDFLTKVYNRRHLFDVGTSLYANAKRGNLNIAVGLVDADFFKKINDTYGHDVGDTALQAIATALQSTLRTSDIVARFGGEEFVCLVALKEAEDSGIVFERVRQSIEDIELAVGDQKIALTVSIGVTNILGESLDDMIKVADTAVYKAKESGRNRVEVTG